MRGDRERLADLVGSLHLGDPRIAWAFRELDRAAFVPPDRRDDAYRDRPVPIPRGQTTSQPSLIAIMIAAAEIGPEDEVLEVGTGYGFQTALLAKLAHHVVSVERWPELAAAARDNLEGNGIVNVSVYVGDGWNGWPEEAPYDAVVVSAAAESVPEALVEQLKEGGRLVVPVTSALSDDVMLYRKTRGALEEVRLVSPARFVPLVKEERKQ